MSDLSNSERRPRVFIRRIGAVTAQTGLSISSVYRLMAAGQFPTPVKLGTGARGWLAHEIDQWLAEKVEKRNRALYGEEMRKAYDISKPSQTEAPLPVVSTEPRPVNPILVKLIKAPENIT
jgi:prophage regulatory protein